MKYTVVVHYEGAVDYTVEAESESEARDIATGLFENEDPEVAWENVDWEVCDSWEEK